MSSLTFTLIQTNLQWEDKEANIQMLEHKINDIKHKTEVVILPEMFSTGFSMKPEQLSETMDGITFEWMRKIASTKKIIITGSIIIKEDEKYFNRLIWMLPNGQYGFYDKRHLFAFGSEDQHYTAGNKKLLASVKGWKIDLQICYDLRFPVWCRQTPLLNSPPTDRERPGKVDVLIFVANWPERRNHAWKTLLQARAIENQCYVIGVNRVGNDGNNINYSGDSMVVNAMGEILYCKTHDEDVFTINLQKEHLEEVRNKFPFWRDADSFTITN